MTFPQIAEKNELWKSRPASYYLWEQVYRQAASHLERDAMYYNYDLARPHEEEIFKIYRQQVTRNVTSEPFDKLTSRIKRASNYANIFSHSNLLTDTLNNHFDANPFNFGVKGVGVDKWTYGCVVPTAFKDGNAYQVDFPYNPSNPQVAPSNSVEDGGLRRNERIAVKHSIIPFYLRYSEDNPNYFMWVAGSWKVDDKVEMMYFFAVDKEAYYVYYPEKVGADIVYRVSLWYRHDCGFIPVTKLPARFSKKTIFAETLEHDKRFLLHGDANVLDNLGQEVAYYESFGKTAFEYLDEFAIRLSINQIVTVKHGYPKFVLTDQFICPDCQGTKSQVVTVGYNNQVKAPCDTCSGSGYMIDASEFSTLAVNNRRSETKGSSNPAYYLNPDPAILNTGWDHLWEFMNKANESLGNDLGKESNESGVAKELRMDQQHDIVKEFLDMLIDYMESTYNNTGCLLDGRADVLVNLPHPSKYQVKSEEQLKAELLDCPAPLLHPAYMEYVKVKHRGDEEMVAKYEFVLKYAPLLMYEEIPKLTAALNIGAYNEDDIIKKDQVWCIVNELCENDDRFLDRPFSEKRELADKWLVDNGFIEDRTLLDFGEFDTENRSKLLDTVGGADAAIKINQAVKNQEMTEAAAEKLLSKFFQISIEEAATLIDIPTGEITDTTITQVIEDGTQN